MQLIPRAVEKLVEEFSRLPGIGPRTAERLTFFLLRSGRESSKGLASAVDTLHDNVGSCEICHNLSEGSVCQVCQHPGRDKRMIAVVEEPLDVVAIEKTGLFNGLYHVLGGVISPIDGIGPDNLHIKSLITRMENGVEEVILATNPSTEGETTAMYIRKQLEPHGLKITRLARGLPVGGDLEYADQITLGRALQGRQDF